LGKLTLGGQFELPVALRDRAERQRCRGEATRLIAKFIGSYASILLTNAFRRLPSGLVLAADISESISHNEVPYSVCLAMGVTVTM